MSGPLRPDRIEGVTLLPPHPADWRPPSVDDPRAFGAMCDGVTDDTAAIQAYLDYHAGRNGDRADDADQPAEVPAPREDNLT